MFTNIKKNDYILYKISFRAEPDNVIVELESRVNIYSEDNILQVYKDIKTYVDDTLSSLRDSSDVKTMPHYVISLQGDIAGISIDKVFSNIDALHSYLVSREYISEQKDNFCILPEPSLDSNLISNESTSLSSSTSEKQIFLKEYFNMLHSRKWYQKFNLPLNENNIDTTTWGSIANHAFYGNKFLFFKNRTHDLLVLKGYLNKNDTINEGKAPQEFKIAWKKLI